MRKKKKIDFKKTKSEIRVGFESMDQFDNGSRIGQYRYYFKGRIALFDVIGRDHNGEEFEGTFGFKLKLCRVVGAIYYDAFQRYDGVVFFLGESEKQAVDKSMRTRDAIPANRFN